MAPPENILDILDHCLGRSLQMFGEHWMGGSSSCSSFSHKEDWSIFIPRDSSGSPFVGI